jgi:hypothetical protein
VHGRLDEAVARGSLRVLVGLEARGLLAVEEGAVAQIVRLHDGRIQRCEIERGDRDSVVGSLGLEHRTTNVFLVGHVEGAHRDEQIFLACFAVELRHDFDLLSAGEQVGDGDTRHTRHLNGIHYQHEFLDQLERKKGIFETIHRKTTACLLGTVLQFADN